MDEVDQRQQDEIVALQKKDIQHDAQLSAWTKISMVIFAVMLAIFVAGFVALPFLSMKINPTINIQIDKDLLSKTGGKS